MLVSSLLAPPDGALTHAPVCDPNDPKSCVQTLIEGEQAPFTGQLLTFRRAAKLAVRATQCQERVDLAHEEEKEVAQVQLNGAEQKRANDRAVFDQQLKLVQDQLALATPEWYERPAFVAPVTVVLTIGVIWATAKILNEIR